MKAALRAGLIGLALSASTADAADEFCSVVTQLAKDAETNFRRVSGGVDVYEDMPFTLPGASRCMTQNLGPQELGSLRCHWAYSKFAESAELEGYAETMVKGFKDCLEPRLEEMDTPTSTIFYGRFRGTTDWVAVSADVEDAEKSVTLWFRLERYPDVKPPPVVSGPAALEVSTDPPGARVILDGAYRGVSPLTVQDLPVDRPLLVEAEWDEGRKRSERVQLAPNVRSLVRLAFVPQGPRGANDASVAQALPEMLLISGGSFEMGCDPAGYYYCEDDEGPIHHVTVKSFLLGKHEVTFDQYDAFAEATNRAKPNDYGWGRGNRPVVDVSWEDAQAFARWLSARTGQRYRLPTEAEWEYAARAGTTTLFSWGDEIGSGRANCYGCGGEWDQREQTAPVGSFAANPFGLHDMNGNVQEWVEDCWNESYTGAPADGSAWTAGNCSRRVARGGTWFLNAQVARAAARGDSSREFGSMSIGFRLAQDGP